MKREVLLVDGYNIIFAWDKLRRLADESLEDARRKLMDILCDYQGFRQNQVILVFDAHMVKNGLGSVTPYHNITLVFTKQAETADNYIEKVSGALARQRQNLVRVATSDQLEQVIILGKGATRVSASELEQEVAEARQEARRVALARKPIKSNQLIDNLDEKTAETLEKLRLTKS